MKIQLPDNCPLCGAEKMQEIDYLSRDYFIKYECGTKIAIDENYKINNYAELLIIGKCADKILVKFGTAETTGYEEKDNENV